MKEIPTNYQKMALLPIIQTSSYIWIGVKDVDECYEEFKLSGASIRKPPTNYPWACEMMVEDLDGHALRIGSEPKDE